MKKLLVLALVLSMASMASAALTLSVSSTELAPSDTAVISFSGDGLDAPGVFYLGIEVGGPGTLLINGATINYTGTASAIFYEDLGGALSTNEPTVHMELNDLPPPGTEKKPLTGLLVSGIVLHCDGPGSVVIDLMNGDGLVLDSKTITQTPEPITIGLLGLGAMLLRRRK